MEAEDKNLLLRDFLFKYFQILRNELSLIRAGIQRMDKRPNSQEFELLKLQVASLAEASQELERRVDLLEKHASAANWIVRQAAVIIFIVVIVWLMGILK